MEKIKKSELNKLLKAYGATLGVLTQSQDDSCEYWCSICNLRIELDPEDPKYYIKVSLSDSTGKCLCDDIWRRDEKAPVLVKKLKDTIAEDLEIKSKNRHIEKLREENQQTKKGLKEKDEDISQLRDEIDLKDEEIYQLKEKLEKMEKKLEKCIKESQPSHEYQKLSKRVGRPKETERISRKSQEISSLIRKGMSDIQIMEHLGITKPTYYRYKRLINSM